jgi:hypothetical protein
MSLQSLVQKWVEVADKAEGVYQSMITELVKLKQPRSAILEAFQALAPVEPAKGFWPKDNGKFVGYQKAEKAGCDLAKSFHSWATMAARHEWRKKDGNQFPVMKNGQQVRLFKESGSGKNKSQVDLLKAEQLKAFQTELDKMRAEGFLTKAVLTAALRLASALNMSVVVPK